jgi:host factor-I protein
MQTATQIKKRNLQDNLLAKLRRSRMGVTMFLVNGFQIRGEIRGYDAFVVIIDSDGKQQMVYKHAISTIIPERPLSWDSEEGDAE